MVRQDFKKMIVKLSTDNTRTLVPITITVMEAPESPIVEIKAVDPTSSLESFVVETHATEFGEQGEFWFQNKGDYIVNVRSAQEYVSKNIHIEDQIFLPFSIEFGLGFGFLCLTLFGVYLWIKTKKRYAQN